MDACYKVRNIDQIIVKRKLNRFVFVFLFFLKRTTNMACKRFIKYSCILVTTVTLLSYLWFCPFKFKLICRLVTLTNRTLTVVPSLFTVSLLKTQGCFHSNVKSNPQCDSRWTQTAKVLLIGSLTRTSWRRLSDTSNWCRGNLGDHG